MRTTDHIAAARGFMETGVRLREWGDNRAAGEVIYGGVAEAINALAHDLGMKRARSVARRTRILGAFINRGKLVKSDNLLFHSNAMALHNHFYRGHLSSEDERRCLNGASALAMRLIALANDLYGSGRD